MRNDIVDTAREYLGTPFRHQGRSALGVDCVGLLVLVAQRLKVPHYDQPNYERRTTGLRFINKFREAGFSQRRLIDRKPGDVIVFRELRETCHVAILAEGALGHETIIHSYASRRRVVEEPYLPQWIDKTVGCYSFPGAE